MPEYTPEYRDPYNPSYRPQAVKHPVYYTGEGPRPSVVVNRVDEATSGPVEEAVADLQESMDGACLDTIGCTNGAVVNQHFCECFPGWRGVCCNFKCVEEGNDCYGFDNGNFELTKVPIEEPWTYMSYAKTGESDLPESMHGIFWMDQRGYVKEKCEASDPNFEWKKMLAANEMLISFGETAWNPESECVGGVALIGGEVGHWTFNNEINSSLYDGQVYNGVWQGQQNGRGYVDFCYVKTGQGVHPDPIRGMGIPAPQDVDELIYIPFKLKYGSAADNTSQSDYQDPYGFSNNWWMYKTTWGWSRVSKGWGFWAYNIEAGTGGTDRMGEYALIQVVDGYGNPTDFYDDYVEYAKTSTPEHDPGLAHGDIPRNYPLVNGSYIALMGKYTGAPSPSPPPIPPSAPGLCDNTCNYASDMECDDGGAGTEYSGYCTLGTDCYDCGVRLFIPPSPVAPPPSPSPPDPPASPPAPPSLPTPPSEPLTFIQKLRSADPLRTLIDKITPDPSPSPPPSPSAPTPLAPPWHHPDPVA